MESIAGIETKAHMCETVWYIWEISSSVRVKAQMLGGGRSKERWEWKSRLDRDVKGPSNVAEEFILYHVISNHWIIIDREENIL